jgi:hypothetical protein
MAYIPCRAQPRELSPNRKIAIGVLILIVISWSAGWVSGWTWSQPDPPPGSRSQGLEQGALILEVLAKGLRSEAERIREAEREAEEGEQ